MGLDVYLNKKGKKDGIIEEDSAKHKDHMFKVGYFRSSYNGGGLNTVLRNAVGSDLYDVFPHEDDKYEFTPDWNKSKGLIQDLRIRFAAFTAKTPVGVSCSEDNIFSPGAGPTNANEALEIYSAETERTSGFGDGGYSNINGDFHIGEPLKVRALIRGTSKMLRKQPCTYVIYDVDHTWYHEALEIVEETIDWVLAQKKPEQYELHWSA